jgi:aminopeptidase N
VAKWSNADDQWLSESTAEYYSAFAMGSIISPNEFKEAMSDWRVMGRRVKDRGSLFLANQLAGDEARADRYALLYAKGPLVLHALRRELGDDKFFTLFKSFLTTFKMQHVETGEIVKMTEWLMQKDYSFWYERYLFGVEWPEVADRKAGGEKRKN